MWVENWISKEHFVPYGTEQNSIFFFYPYLAPMELFYFAESSARASPNVC